MEFTTIQLRVASLFVHASSDKRKCGVAFLQPIPRQDMGETKRRKLVLYEFLDTEQYANLESLLIQLQLDQLYFAEKSADETEMKKVKAVLEKQLECLTEPAPNSMFLEGDVLKRIEKLTDTSPYIFEREETQFARRAAAGLMNKCSELSLEESAGTAVAELGRLGTFVRLDSAAVQALNVLPTAKDAVALTAASTGPGPLLSSGTAASTSSMSTSLLGLLACRCKSKAGRKTVRTWLLQPLMNVEEICVRQDIVEAFAQHPALLSSWQQRASSVDIESLAHRLASGKSGLSDLVRVYSFCVALPSVVQVLREAGKADGAMVDESGVPAHPGLALLRGQYGAPLADAAGESKLARLRSLCDELLQDPTDMHRPLVNRAYEPELERIGAELDEAQAAVQGVFKKAERTWASDWGDGALKLEHDRANARGWVFRASRKLDKAVYALPGVNVHAVLKDGMIFSTSPLLTANEAVGRLQREYDKASAEIISKAVAIAATYVPCLEAVNALLGTVDALASFGHVATLPGYCRPQVSADGMGGEEGEGATRRVLTVKAGRHPLVEMQDGTSFIANDYMLADPVPGAGTGAQGAGEAGSAGRFQIVTGPNMGGKSTYIRTLGVLIVMSQAGSFIPAESASLPLFDAVLARVGAGDAASKGVSTFMAEMLEAGTILATATARSLVLIDELGRGTSTYDGFGLAWAISEQLAVSTCAFTLFATHFHELCALADETQAVKNKHVTAHTSGGRITMLYSVEDGPCPSSFGVHVAELAGFPQAVVDMARSKAGELEATASALLQEASTGGLGSEKKRSRAAAQREALVSALRALLTQQGGAAGGGQEASPQVKRQKVMQALAVVQS